MKIIEVLKFNRELIKRLKTAGIRLEDEAYVDLYTDYTTFDWTWRKSIVHCGASIRQVCCKRTQSI